MGTLGVYELRRELETFAESTLQRKLDELSSSLQAVLRDDAGSQPLLPWRHEITPPSVVLPHVAESPREGADSARPSSSRLRSSARSHGSHPIIAAQAPALELDPLLEPQRQTSGTACSGSQDDFFRELREKLESKPQRRMPRTKSMASSEMRTHISALRPKGGQSITSIGSLGALHEGSDSEDGLRKNSEDHRKLESPVSAGTFSHHTTDIRATNIGGHFMPKGIATQYLKQSHTVHKWDVSPLRLKAIKLCRKSTFEQVVIAVIILNAFYIGIATQIMAVEVRSDPPIALDAIELIFMFIFVGELCLKFFAFRFQLFRLVLTEGDNKGNPNPNFAWNVFDWSVIGLQVVELTFRYANVQMHLLQKISLLRVLRVVRITRILRLVKVFAFVKDLRTIVNSIVKSMPLFLWSICALFVGTYLWAVYFTEIILAHKLELRDSGQQEYDGDWELLDRYFRSLDIAMLSLLQAVTGGLDWGDIAEPLRNMMWTGLVPYLVYVMFALLAMMNVITGVFLEFATERAKEEREFYLMQNARMVFQAADYNSNGTITWPDFEAALADPNMESFFDAIDLDISDAHTLFNLLDSSRDGFISADEFLCGCLRLRGAAKSLDLVVLAREVNELSEANKQAILTNISATESNKEAILENQRLLAKATTMLSRMSSSDDVIGNGAE